jgi:hypothetical protein
VKHHPYSNIWPMMTGPDFENLKADIKANGLRLPVLTYKGAILDGRNRALACDQTGIEVRYQEAKATTDEDALALVVSLNDHRRHLSENQRALAASKLANIIHGHNQHIEKIMDTSNEVSSISAEAAAAHHPVSTVAAARAMNVPLMRLTRMRGVEKYGTKEELDAVLKGDVSLDKQYNKVKPKREKQPKPEKRAKPGRPAKGEQKPPIRHKAATFLTQEQVDPEFKGTRGDFIAKYGHVNVHTAEQYATMKFAEWASNMKAIASCLKKLPAAREVDHNWLRNPEARDVVKLTEALNFLRPKIAEAEALLATATAAAAKKTG